MSNIVEDTIKNAIEQAKAAGCSPEGIVAFLRAMRFSYLHCEIPIPDSSWHTYKNGKIDQTGLMSLQTCWHYDTLARDVERLSQ